MTVSRQVCAKAGAPRLADNTAAPNPNAEERAFCFHFMTRARLVFISQLLTPIHHDFRVEIKFRFIATPYHDFRVGQSVDQSGICSETLDVERSLAFL
jgi:hypothetical protein